MSMTKPTPKPKSGADHDAINAITQAHDGLKRARTSVTRASARLDTVVATTVSTEPTSLTWYDHPGYVTREQVCQATGMSTASLHKLMERYRNRAATPKRKPKAGR